MFRGYIILLFFLIAACSRVPDPIVISGPTMGSHYLVKLLELPPGKTKTQLQQDIQSILDHIESVASTWIADSELSRFNKAPVGSFPASSTLRDLIALAIRACTETSGSLDVTVGPIVNLWGFGPDADPEYRPNAEQIAKAMETVGCHHLNVKGESVVKSTHVTVDLSSITQGYAGVKIAEFLDGLRVSGYLVDLSGELVSKGKKYDGTDWRIAVEVPRIGKLMNEASAESIQKVVLLKGKSIATSGDYRNFIEFDGQTLSHIIDPATGVPVKHGLASVTVLDNDLAWADALSTAIMVMGPEKGLAFANEKGIPALFIVRTDNGFEEYMTSLFEEYVTTQ